MIARSALVVALMLAPFSVALAQPSMQEKVESHLLFERAMVAYRASDYGKALPIFQASFQLDAGVGTLLYIGECHAQLGQTASAWGAFKEAAALANRLGDNRAELARKTAEEIEGRLAYLSLVVSPATQVDGLVVTRGGRVVPPSLLGVAIPVDPGEYKIEASAPGKTPRVEVVQIKPEAGRIVYTLTPLDDSTTPQAKAPERPEPQGREEPPVLSRRGVFGFSMAGVGLVTGAVGGLLMLTGADKAGEANSNKDADGYRSAARLYTGGAITAGIGAALLAGGVALVLTKPAEKPRSAWPLTPVVGVGQGGVLFSTRW